MLKIVHSAFNYEKQQKMTKVFKSFLPEIN